MFAITTFCGQLRVVTERTIDGESLLGHAEVTGSCFYVLAFDADCEEVSAQLNEWMKLLHCVERRVLDHISVHALFYKLAKRLSQFIELF